MNETIEKLKAEIADAEQKAEAFSQQRSDAEKASRKFKKIADEKRKELLQAFTSAPTSAPKGVKEK